MVASPRHGCVTLIVTVWRVTCRTNPAARHTRPGVHLRKASVTMETTMTTISIGVLQLLGLPRMAQGRPLITRLSQTKVWSLLSCSIELYLFFKIISKPLCSLKALANGPNIVGQQHPSLLGPTMLCLVASVCMEPQQCCHLLALVAYSLKPVKLLGLCKRTQHCWPTTPNNVGCCWHLLRPFAWALNLPVFAFISSFLSVFIYTEDSLPS